MPRKKPRPFPNYVAPEDGGATSSSANGDVSMDTDGNPIAGPSSAPASGSGGGVITPAIRKQMSLEGIEAYEMPKAVLARVAKAELPESVQIRREALLAISKSATIFISYLSAVADELAKQNNRKTILPVDVVEGLGLMEFPEEMRSELKREVREFRALEEGKRRKGVEKGGEKAAGTAAGGGGDGEEQVGAGPAGGDDEDEDEENEGAGARDASAAAVAPESREASDEQDDDARDQSMSTDAAPAPAPIPRPQDPADRGDSEAAQAGQGDADDDEEMGD